MPKRKNKGDDLPFRSTLHVHPHQLAALARTLGQDPGHDRHWRSPHGGRWYAVGAIRDAETDEPVEVVAKPILSPARTPDTTFVVGADAECLADWGPSHATGGTTETGSPEPTPEPEKDADAPPRPASDAQGPVIPPGTDYLLRTAEDVAKLDHLEKITKQAEREAALLTKWEGLHDAAADAKKALDAASRELSDLILAGAKPLPLFDKKPEAKAEDTPPAEDWHAVRLGALKDPAIPPGLLLKLADAGIETLGKLAQSYLGKVPGVGPASVDKIGAATDAYWKRHPQKAEVAGQLLPTEEPAPEAAKSSKKAARKRRPPRGGLAE